MGEEVKEKRMIDEEKAANILQWYETIEVHMVDFLEFVPPQGHNLKTWSPRLATIIVETCELIDSLFRYISPEEVLLRGKKIKREDLNLSHFAALYGSNLRLSNSRVILLVSPPKYIVPFSSWSKLLPRGLFESPSWWTTYNDLKHNRIDCFDKATIEMAIEALAGSLLVIACLSELVPALVRKRWIDTGGWSPQYIIEQLSKGGFEKTLETSLFAVWLGYRELPDNIEDFSPLRFGGSTKLAAFFGKH